MKVTVGAEDDGREARQKVRAKYPKAFVGPKVGVIYSLWPPVKVVYKDGDDHRGIGRGSTFAEAWRDAANKLN